MKPGIRFQVWFFKFLKKIKQKKKKSGSSSVKQNQIQSSYY
jgi:hypothetical protein